MAADDGGVGSNAGSAPHVGAGVLAAAVDRAARVRYVGEHAAGTEEDIIVARDLVVAVAAASCSDDTVLTTDASLCKVVALYS